MTISRPWRRGLIAVTILAAIFVVLMIGSWLLIKPKIAQVPPDPTSAPLPLLMKPIADGPQAALLRRGRDLVIAGDCASCHVRKLDKPFEGGLGLQTPYGVIYSANLTGDKKAGIGGWSDDDFWRAMSHGIGPGGRHLYPAFPYNYFTGISRQDSDAILAYLKTVPPSGYVPPHNLLPIPMSFRPVLIGWNLMFLKNARFVPDAAQSPPWNRGAALVNGLGHCGACHTPMNLAGAPEQSRFLHGATLNGWVAPDLTGNPRTGLGRWSEQDIVTYLKTGRNAHANAAGPMGEVVSYSTSLMSDEAVGAIATYLKSLPSSPSAAIKPADPASLRRGAAVFTDACTGCHLSSGRGQPGYFPPLPGSAVAQQRDPSGLLQIILGGARTAPTPARPSALTMPSFAWKLSDSEAADVANYVRNSWGNAASPVSAGEAEKVRKSSRFVAKTELR